MQALQDRHLVDPRAGIAAVGAVAIFAAGIVLGSLIDPDAISVGSAGVVPLADRRYDAIEELRLGNQSVPLGDRRYDAIEETRLGNQSVPLGDRRYDAIEESRLGNPSVPLGDRRYDAVEETRAGLAID